MVVVCFSPLQLSSHRLRLWFLPSLLHLLPWLLTSFFAHGILSPKMESDIQFMQAALEEARSAAVAGEVPIGAVLAHGGKILARSGNRTIRNNDPTGGAVRSCFEILSHSSLNHQVEVASGVLAAESAAILQSFFAERR